MIDKKDIHTPTEEAPGAETALASTPVDLERLGLNQVAYIRRAVFNHEPVWSIHNALGQAVATAPTYEAAWAAIVQNDLQPVSLH